MAINLGSAYVDIVPSTSGLAPKIRQQVDKPLEDAGRSGAKKFAEQFSSGVGGFAKAITAPLASAMSSAMSSAGQAAMRALETTAAAGGAFLATSLVAGYNRLTTIQDATAALTISLGDATAAAAVLDDVLGVVRGTPFNLDQFAAAAQRLIGFGIEAEKIPTYLTAIGEASATQGRRANEFADRLATVFGQVAASGQVSLADVWRISDAGVNALAILANHFGVTRDAMKDMISKGAVPAGEALDALAKGIVEGSDGIAGSTRAFGGSMARLRETLTGASGGFRAATARLGESILTPFSGVMTEMYNALSDTLDTIGTEMGDWGARFAASSTMDRVRGFFADLPDHIERIKSAARDLGPALAPLAAFVGAAGLGGLASALGPFGAIIPTINPVVAAFAAWVVTNDQLRDAFKNLSEAVWDALGRIGQAAAPIIESVGPGLEAALAGFVNWLADTAVPAITDFAEKALAAVSRWWDENGDDVIAGLTEFGRVLREDIWPVLEGIGTFLYRHLITPLGELLETLVTNESTWTVAAYGIAGVAAAMLLAGLAAHPVLLAALAVSALTAATTWLAETFNDELSTAIEWVIRGWAGFVDIVETVVGWLKTAYDWVVKVVEAAEKIPVIGGGGGGWSRFIPNMPGPWDDILRGLKFDNGGVVPGPRGVHSPHWVAGGETILPTHKMDLDSALAAVGVGGAPHGSVHLHVTQMPGEDQVSAGMRALRHHQRIREQVVAR